MAKIKYGADDIRVSVFKNGDTVTFVNLTDRGIRGARYAWEVYSALDGSLVCRIPFSENPSFAYTFSENDYLMVIARVMTDTEKSAKIYQTEENSGKLPEVKLMYVRNGKKYRFTNLTSGNGLEFAWQVYEVKDGAEIPAFFSNRSTSNVFEYGFINSRSYVVKAFSSRGAFVRSKTAAVIPAGGVEKL